MSFFTHPGQKGKVYENGNFQYVANFKNGELDGKLITYDENGNITKEQLFKDGECIKGCDD